MNNYFNDNLDQTGQHYMVDSKLIKFIVDSSDLSSKDRVLEIGYGHGALTKELSKKASVVAVDIGHNDLDFKAKDLEIVQGNILDIFEKLHSKHKFNKIVSNIPYNISEPLMRKIFKTDIEIILLTVGKKFADILMDEKNRIGIIANRLYDVELLQTVKPISFDPRPKVDSAVVKLVRKKSHNASLYQKIVMLDELKLKNALIKSFTHMTKSEVRELTGNRIFNKRLYELDNKEFIEFDSMIKSFLKN